MRAVWTVFSSVVFLFLIALFGRLAISWIQVFARDWRPRGIVLVLAEAVYTVTDPPLHLIRKVVPTVNLGGVRVDLAFLVLFFITTLLLGLQPF
jgi:YggT family protein